MIYRIQKRDNPYAQIDKAILNNPRLSFKAKGLLAFLLSCPPDWMVRSEHLKTVSSDRGTAVASAMKELRAEGYATLEITRDSKGRVMGKQWAITETPVSRVSDNPSFGKPETTNKESNQEGLKTKNERYVDEFLSHYEKLPINVGSVTLTQPRRTAIIARMREQRFRENLPAILFKIDASDFCQGSTGWRATLDWLLKPGTYGKVLDGNYDNRSNGKQPLAANDYEQEANEQKE